ncbi:hypothetical protein BLNAU_17714 [Blattamonas nauphoetae]|uniref:Uncharacterized protein n=1 Tax=Blattamonas nauphoetae TaxID=2049346 RepID=A0ABQ9X6D2_9EUKA|nr:hypothetical protein BLNAU_17714 [Blattamonas nauphoetae]
MMILPPSSFRALHPVRAKIPVGADGSEITKTHQSKPNDGGDQVHDLKKAGEDEGGASVIPIHVRGNTITPVHTSELVDELINPPMTQTSRGRSMEAVVAPSAKDLSSGQVMVLKRKAMAKTNLVQPSNRRRFALNSTPTKSRSSQSGQCTELHHRS